MTPKFLPFFALTIIPLSFPASAATSSSASQTFVQKATIGNQFEILSSQVALDRSQNDDIRQFAQDMIQDHEKAGQDMKAALTQAKKENSRLKEPSKQLDSKHKQILQDLKAAPAGDSFDREYTKAQIDAHNETLALFRDYSENGDNTALKNFATATVPTLEAHKQHVDELAMPEEQEQSQ